MFRCVSHARENVQPTKPIEIVTEDEDWKITFLYCTLTKTHVFAHAAMGLKNATRTSQ